MSKILSLETCEISDAMTVIRLNYSLVRCVNSNGLNLMSTLLIRNQNLFLPKPPYNYHNMKKWTNTLLNLMFGNQNKYSKHVLSNNLNCSYVNMNLILDIAFRCTCKVAFAQWWHALFKILNLLLGSSHFPFLETLCKKEIIIMKNLRRIS